MTRVIIVLHFSLIFILVSFVLPHFFVFIRLVFIYFLVN